MGERKRRLSSAWGLKQAPISDDESVELLEPNDDEMEKRSRVTIDVPASSPLRAKNNNQADSAGSPKRDPLTSKKRKSVGWGIIHDKENQFPSSASQKPSTPSTAHLSNDQLADLYSNCIKLSTENVCNSIFFAPSFFILPLFIVTMRSVTVQSSQLTSFKLENKPKKFMAIKFDRLYGGCPGAPGGVWRQPQLPSR